MIPSDQSAMELGAYLARALPGTPPWAIRRILADRQVKREGARLAASDCVYAGDELTIYLPKGFANKAVDPPKIPTVYEDKRIWLVNKPQGIACQGADDPHGQFGVLELLQGQSKNHALALCHRLDHQTGGLLLFAKDGETEGLLRHAFAHQRIDKLYTCLTVGTPEPERAELRAFLGKDAKAARVTVRDVPFAGALPIRTAYRVLESGPIARVEMRLITGRTHQIRAHLAYIGHPILGDDKYGDRAANRAHGVRTQRLWATGLALHGGTLGSLDGLRFEVKAPF